MPDHEPIFEKAAVVSALTMVSRVGGLVRDATLAFLFGASATIQADAFLFAFMVPNLFRRLLAEGATSIAFIPVFSEYRARHTEEENRKLQNVAFTWFVVVLAAVAAAGALLGPWIARTCARGFDAEKAALAGRLLRVMFPYLFLVGVAAFFVALLHTRKHFTAPAAGPILFNVGIIAMALGLARVTEPPALGAAVGVLCGGVLQAALQIPFLRRRGVRLRPDFTRGHPGVRKMVQLMGPAVFGVAVYQVNILVGILLASFCKQGSMAYLYFANRFVELPLGVFAVAIATVALPWMAESAARQDPAQLRRTYASSLRMALFVCVPSMVWLAMMRAPVITAFLEHGKFVAADTARAAQVFLAASLGIWAIAGARITVPAFYAMKRPGVPVAAGIVSFAVNAGLGAWFVFRTDLGVVGLALAGAIAAAVRFLLLAAILRAMLGRIEGRRLVAAGLRIGVAAGVLAAAAWGFGALGLWAEPGRKLWKIAAILGALGACGLAYTGTALALGLEEARTFLDVVLRRRTTTEENP
jgi:putative peptidoglycan lipid II flippase